LLFSLPVFVLPLLESVFVIGQDWPIAKTGEHKKKNVSVVPYLYFAFALVFCFHDRIFLI